MQRNDQNTRTEGRLLEEGIARGGQRGGRRMMLFLLLAILCTVSAFFIRDERTGNGDVSRTVSYFEEFFDENKAIAVFLGWEGE